MSAEEKPDAAQGDEALSAEARQRVEELIEEEEGVHTRYGGALGVIVTALAVVMSLFHLYAAVEIVPDLEPEGRSRREGSLSTASWPSSQAITPVRATAATCAGCGPHASRCRM